MKVINIMYQTSFTKGQELVAQRLALQLQKQGCKSYLVTSPYHDNKPVISPKVIATSVKGYIWSNETEFGVPVIRVDGYHSTWPPRRIMLRDFVNALRRLYEEIGFDVMITHSTLWNGPEDAAKFVLWVRALMAEGLLQKPVIFCHMSHYQPPDPTHYSLIERSYREAWNRLVFPQIFRTADLILCTTPLEEEDMLRLGARREQIHLYPGGVDSEFIDNAAREPEKILERHNIPTDVKLVSYVGTIEERKNPLAVVRAAKLLTDRRDIHFVIAGAPSNQHEKVQRESRGLHNLSYVGRLNDEEKVALMKKSYLNIIMSRMEALGITQLEFMYCGVPVVTSAVGGQRWVVRDGIDGIHVKGPEDYRGAAAAIRRLAEDQELHDKMSENARSRAQQFTLQNLTEGLLQRLKKLYT